MPLFQQTLNAEGAVSFFSHPAIKIRNARGLTSNSQSDSYMMEAVASINGCTGLQDIRVMLKFSHMVIGKRQRYESLRFEKDVYSCIVHTLDTPFFAHPYAVKESTDLKDLEAIGQLTSGSVVGDKIGFVMTEHCGSTTLRDFMSRSLYRYGEWYSAILQCLVALRYLRKRRVRHGDLHLGNIMYPTYAEIHKGTYRAATVKRYAIILQSTASWTSCRFDPPSLHLKFRAYSPMIYSIRSRSRTNAKK